MYPNISYRPNAHKRIEECYLKKQPIDYLADIMDSMAQGVILENRPLVETYLREIARVSDDVQTALMFEGDRVALKELLDRMVAAGYEGLRKRFEQEGALPRGEPLRHTFAGEVVLCACPCLELEKEVTWLTPKESLS